jgi:outer membrane protein OmpA-like peptidoglycan-associated protein
VFFSVFSQEKSHIVYFETGLSEVTSIEKNRLVSFLGSLKKEKVLSVKIFGFCDDVGASSYNLSLSQKRAEEIKKILLSGFLEENKIKSVDGKGELLLKIVSESSPDRIRALNRRVEISVDYKKSNPKKKVSLTKGSSLVIKDLLFLTGYSYLAPGSKKNLDIAFEKIKNIPFSFVIQGHVCCTTGGEDAINKATKKRNLSVVRAKFVYDYFIKKGIDPKRMSYKGMGHRFPLGGSAEKDKRVEILILSDF